MSLARFRDRRESRTPGTTDLRSEHEISTSTSPPGTRGASEAGGRAEALQVRRALEAKAETGYVPATEFTALDTALGEYDRALDGLGRAVRERSRSLPSIGINPLFRPLRSHPRFIRLVARLGVAPTPN